MQRTWGSITAWLLVGATAWSCTSHDSGTAASSDETPVPVPAPPVVARAPTWTPPTPFPRQDPNPPPGEDPYSPPADVLYPSLGLGADSGAPSDKTPQEEPESDDDSDLGLLVEDLAVAKTEGGRSRLYIESAQVLVGAEWAGSEDLETPPDLAGGTLHGICLDGVAVWQARLVDQAGLFYDVQLTRKTGSPPPGLCLVTRTRPPSPRARLKRRALARSVADKTRLGAWVGEKLGYKMTSVGEIRAEFGGGVDRIVVFRPTQEWNFQSDEDPPHGDVALLVASGAPLGLLPFTDYEDDPSFISSDLQVSGVFDGDGDGVDEVLWLSMDNVEDGSGPRLQVSYFSGGKHRVHVVLMKAYTRVREFGGRERP
jgi:hypothetical protein